MLLAPVLWEFSVPELKPDYRERNDELEELHKSSRLTTQLTFPDAADMGESPGIAEAAVCL